MDNLTLLFSSMLVGNIVLSQFLGICPFVGVSRKKESALGMGLAVIFIIIISSLITYGLYHLVLVPLNIEYLLLILFILVIASLVQILEILMKRYFVSLYQMLGIYLPLITTNCAVLGVAKTSITNGFDFMTMLSFAVGSSLGYAVAIYLFASIRGRLETADIPRPFKDIPVALLTIALMALAFRGFSGLF